MLGAMARRLLGRQHAGRPPAQGGLLVLEDLRWLIKNEDGLTSVEYALLLALIVVVALATWQTLGTKVTAKVNNVAKAIQ
jgi:Flp pilus assembly pilin Flp